MRVVVAGGAMLWALCSIVAYAEAPKRCVWMMDSGTQLATLSLADSYAGAHLYGESLDVLAALDPDLQTPDAMASIHLRRGGIYRALGELDQSRHHLLLAIESERLPLHVRAYARDLLMRVHFERGEHREAAAHGHLSRSDYFAASCTDKDDQSVAALDLRFAKYLSHADRAEALRFARKAVAKAAPGTLAVEDLQWVAMLEQGPAPAQIPPPARPWLNRPPPRISRAEAQARITWITRYRKLIRQPPSPLADSGEISMRWVTREVVGVPPSISAPAIRMAKPELSPPAGESRAMPVLPVGPE